MNGEYYNGFVILNPKTGQAKVGIFMFRAASLPLPVQVKTLHVRDGYSVPSVGSSRT